VKVWRWPLKRGESWFKSWREVLGFIFHPSPPSRIMYITDEDDTEHYYDDEVTVRSNGDVSTVVLTPKFERESAKGPRVVHCLGDPWEKSILSSAFDLPGIRGAATAWIIVWMLIFYAAIYIPGILLVFSPPFQEVEIGGVIYRVVPTGWSPSALSLSLWLLATGYCLMWILYNIFKFKDSSITNISLIEVGRISGTSICLPLPRPLSTLSPREFISKLGKRGPVEFIEKIVKAFAGTLATLVRENRQLRAQALEALEGIKRSRTYAAIEKDLTLAAHIKAAYGSKALGIIIVFVLGAILGAVIGYFIGANFAVEASTAIATGV